MNESLKNILGSLGGPQWVSLCGSQGLRLQHTDLTVARVKFVEQPQDPHYSHVQGRWAIKKKAMSKVWLQGQEDMLEKR